jgi:hypothetical protein
MSLGKLITAGTLVGLGWQQQELLLAQAKRLSEAYPAIRTYVEMSSYRTGLAAYMAAEEGRVPPDLGTWLNETYSSNVKQDAGVDFFGTPYTLERESARVILRSCGADRSRGTDDDLVVVVFENK